MTPGLALLTVGMENDQWWAKSSIINVVTEASLRRQCVNEKKPPSKDPGEGIPSRGNCKGKGHEIETLSKLEEGKAGQQGWRRNRGKIDNDKNDSQY